MTDNPPISIYIHKIENRSTFKIEIGYYLELLMPVPSKCLSNFWRIFEMSLITFEINLILIWSASCVIASRTVVDQETTFAIRDTKFHILVVTLSTNFSVKLSQQLKSGLKCNIDWIKYQSEATRQARNQYLDYLIDSSFQGINRLFVLSFENNTQ